MTWLLEILSLLLTWGYALVFFAILQCFLPVRRNRLLQAAAYVTCVFLSDCIVYANDLPSLLGPMLGFLAYLLAFHRGGLLEKLSVLLVLYPALIAVNYLMMDAGSRLFFSLAGSAGGPAAQDDPSLTLAGMALYALSKLLRLLFWLAVWRLLRGSLQKIGAGPLGKVWRIVDVLMLASFAAVFTILYFLPEDTAIAYPICGASLCSSFGCIYLAAWISEAVQNAQRLEQLEAQREYYKGLLREEERVRSVYHDLKNHLLVLQAGKGETARSLQTLQSQLEGYETYRQTGNEYLDILLHQKACAAKGKGIDFQAQIDARDAGFLEPLDIGTIFGNAMDNAIEACEKLPPERRLITVKMSRVHDLLVFAVENTAVPGAEPERGSSKADALLHGFGLPNLRRAVKKYGGECSAVASDGRFVLKVLLPIP